MIEELHNHLERKEGADIPKQQERLAAGDFLLIIIQVM